MNNLTGERIERHNLLNLIPEHFNAHGQLFIHRNNLYGVTSNPEGASLKGHIVSLILNIDKLT